GLLTTADDMGRFLSAMLASARGGRSFLKAGTVAEMWRRQNGKQKADLDFSVGLGWWLGPVDSLPGETVVVHGGDWLPFCSLALVLPERDLAIFVMANSLEGDSSMSLEPLALELLRAFAASERGVELGRAEAAGPSRPVPADLRARLVGDWASLAGLIRIGEAGGRLKIGFAGKTFDAALRTDGRVEMQLRLLGCKLPVAALEEFQLSAEESEGRPLLGFRSHGILLSACERVAPVEPGPEWRARVGRYRLVNAAEGLVRDVELGLSPEGYLTLRYKFFGGPRPREYPLAVLDGKRAILMGSGRNLGESVVAELREGRERLRWSGFLLERR
ncbi:MAG: serine hydrolase, partial [Spirochaetaceae bacterium]|nr:serine hydrolase [Spirochaetaceae bacterium]